MKQPILILLSFLFLCALVLLFVHTNATPCFAWGTDGGEGGYGKGGDQ